VAGIERVYNEDRLPETAVHTTEAERDEALAAGREAARRRGSLVQQPLDPLLMGLATLTGRPR
jgi:hypothetical protein